MIFTTIVLIFSFWSPEIWAEQNCTDYARSKDIFVNGNAITECYDGKKYVTKCIINDTNDLEFDYIVPLVVESLYKGRHINRTLRRWSRSEKCNHLMNMLNGTRTFRSKIKHDSFAAMLSKIPAGANIIREKGKKIIDYKDYIGVPLEDTVNFSDISCKKANLVYKIVRIESNSWIECDTTPKRERVQKFKRCLLKKQPFSFEYIDIDDMNRLKRHSDFRGKSLPKAEDFCDRLQPHYQKIIEILGNNSVKSVLIDEITDSNVHKDATYEIDAHDNGRVYYFREADRYDDAELNCQSKEDFNKIYIIASSVTKCQYDAEWGSYRQKLTECIIQEDQDRLKYLTVKGLRRLKNDYKLSLYFGREDIQFCNSLARDSNKDDLIRSSLFHPEHHQFHEVKVGDIIPANQSVTWFRIPHVDWYSLPQYYYR